MTETDGDNMEGINIEQNHKFDDTIRHARHLISPLDLTLLVVVDEHHQSAQHGLQPLFIMDRNKSPVPGPEKIQLNFTV